ncbi:hypothetical protein AYO47_09860 [Planctomyces sp. SCGC AG-212-M04]|nr:hypothetical protein AYO47_09860 [Planctomyces sp. SCGC AG-212-M04]
MNADRAVEVLDGMKTSLQSGSGGRQGSARSEGAPSGSAERGRTANPEGRRDNARLRELMSRRNRVDEFLLLQEDDDGDRDGRRGREFADQAAIGAVTGSLFLVLGR